MPNTDVPVTIGRDVCSFEALASDERDKAMMKSRKRDGMVLDDAVSTTSKQAIVVVWHKKCRAFHRASEDFVWVVDRQTERYGCV